MQLTSRILGNDAVHLANLYGPAECTINASAKLCQMSQIGRQGVSIGSLLPNTTGYVLDQHYLPAPIGVAGELYLGGPKLSRGYIGRPDLTTAAFHSLPSLPHAGRLYKTGDRVRWLRDGNLDFLGRVDFQIKLNGQRIETGEIEAVLQEAEGVSEALVVVVAEGALVAYVVPADVPEAVLKQACKAVLPRYMVPVAFVGLDAWPLNASGKVDRKALPAPTLQSSSKHVAPRTQTERWVSDVVAEVLGKADAPSVEQELLPLGLTSLKAVMVSALLKQRHGQAVSSAEVMRLSTIAEIARGSMQGKAAIWHGAALVRRRRTLEHSCQLLQLPLSHEQEQMWTLYNLSPDARAAYNMPYMQRLKGQLCMQPLRDAVRAVAEKHEVLRMQYGTDTEGKSFQTPIAMTDWELAVEEMWVQNEAEVCCLIAISHDTHHAFTHLLQHAHGHALSSRGLPIPSLKLTLTNNL